MSLGLLEPQRLQEVTALSGSQGSCLGMCGFWEVPALKVPTSFLSAWPSLQPQFLDVIVSPLPPTPPPWAPRSYLQLSL